MSELSASEAGWGEERPRAVVAQEGLPRELTPAELARYSRHITIPEIGVSGQERLASARVVLVGAGGLGSPVAMYLAAAGVGTLGIIDDDVVELSNLQRQILHRDATLGTPKVDSARAQMESINPHITVNTYPVRLTQDNALDILGEYDIIVDGSDNFVTRFLVSDACSILDKPVVWGSVFRFDGQVTVFWDSQGPTYRDLLPVPPPPGSVPSCSEAGIFGAICASIGAIQATEVIKLITCIGKPLIGTVLLYDALDQSWTPMRLPKRPERPIIEPLTEIAWSCDTMSAQTDISPTDLQAQLAKVQLIDVREDFEVAICTLPNTIHVPLGRLNPDELDLPKDAEIVVYCKVGGRSSAACGKLRDAGFTNVRNLTGGILGYIKEVDPSMEAY